MDLNEIAVFVKVVETGSFVGAASLLEMPKSTVSSKVSALEHRLGVTLIRRTTRRLFVTDVGREYYNYCLQALRQIGQAEEKIGQQLTVPQGVLRITAPVELGGALLPEVIREYRKQYPEVELELVLTDHKVDLVSEGFDLAIRAGELEDSSLRAKKIGTTYFSMFASPQYLKKRGTPKNPKEITNHDCVQFGPLGHQNWKVQNGRGVQSISLSRKLIINDLNLIKSLTIGGAGIALLPSFFCHGEVKGGKLVPVLKDWRSEVRPVSFVYPAQDFVPRKLSAFLEIAMETLRTGLALQAE